MSHPVNRQDRFVKGDLKSKKRVFLFFFHDEKKEKLKRIIFAAKRHRNTTKKCSCAFCGNPRKYFNEKTMQEKRFGGYADDTYECL